MSVRTKFPTDITLEMSGFQPTYQASLIRYPMPLKTVHDNPQKFGPCPVIVVPEGHGKRTVACL